MPLTVNFTHCLTKKAHETGGKATVGSYLSDLLSKETAMPLAMKEKQGQTAPGP